MIKAVRDTCVYLLFVGAGILGISPLSFVVIIVLYGELGVSWTHRAQGDLTALLAVFITVYVAYIPCCYIIRQGLKLSSLLTLRWKWIAVLLVVFPVTVFLCYIYLPLSYQNRGLGHALWLNFLGCTAITSCASVIVYFAPLSSSIFKASSDKS